MDEDGDDVPVGSPDPVSSGERALIAADISDLEKARSAARKGALRISWLSGLLLAGSAGFVLGQLGVGGLLLLPLAAVPMGITVAVYWFKYAATAGELDERRRDLRSEGGQDMLLEPPRPSLLGGGWLLEPVAETTMPPQPESDRVEDSAPTIRLLDEDTGHALGLIMDWQLQFLAERLEGAFYIDASTLEMLQEEGADPALLKILRTALRAGDGITIGWDDLED